MVGVSLVDDGTVCQAPDWGAEAREIADVEARLRSARDLATMFEESGSEQVIRKKVEDSQAKARAEVWPASYKIVACSFRLVVTFLLDLAALRIIAAAYALADVNSAKNITKQNYHLLIKIPSGRRPES
eukprot:7272149-Pyramimonas_sp.AAC.1